jgi:RNA polymerase sigma-70 factor, ECF subfamily
VANADFETLIERHYPRIRRAAMLLSGDAWEAEDLAQETFLQAMQSWHRFDETNRVETWLYAILVNLDRKRRRRHVRGWRRITTWFARQDGDSDHQSPSDLIEVQEWKQSVWSAVANLPGRQQQTIVLRYAEGLSYEEVAHVMDCPTGTVKSRLHHGLAALRNKLELDETHRIDEPTVGQPCCGEKP